MSLDVTSYEVTIENGEVTIDVGNAVVNTLISRAKNVAIGSGQITVEWTFASTLTGSVTDYVPQCTIQNTADSSPIEGILSHIELFNTSKVRAKLRVATDTGNYSACFAIIPVLDG